MKIKSIYYSWANTPPKPNLNPSTQSFKMELIMTTCIICRLEKDNMSDEHVIPDSLGGYYHVHTVCRDCNSLLGTKVDTHLINNKFGELYRSRYNLKGKPVAFLTH